MTIFIVPFIVAMIVIGVVVFRSNHSSYSFDTASETDPNHRYQINASVSQSFYEDVQSYCQKNNISVSALIRNAVTDYMKTSQTSSSFTTHSSFKSSNNKTGNSSDSWKCPHCGRINASYVGTCACGKSK